MTVTELMVELQRLARAGEGGRRVVVPVCSYGEVACDEDLTSVELGEDHTARVDWE